MLFVRLSFQPFPWRRHGGRHLVRIFKIRRARAVNLFRAKNLYSFEKTVSTVVYARGRRGGIRSQLVLNLYLPHLFLPERC